MIVSTKGRYALRVMIDLAQNDQGQWISLSDIAKRQQISVKYLEAVIAVLNRAGLVRSKMGKNGGYRLAKAPEEYVIGDILRLTEGGLAPVSCLESETNQCGRAESSSDTAGLAGTGPFDRRLFGSNNTGGRSLRTC